MSALSTTNAIKHLLGGTDGKGSCLFTMKRAKAKIGIALLF
jgi:hypothetical protein